MWTMAQSGWQDWLWPNISGLPVPEPARWLSGSEPSASSCSAEYWGAPLSARIAPLCFFLIGAYSVWHTTYLLGRRTEAQPMRLAFGGHPETLAYGRVLADGALLIYLGCLGLLMHSHETSVEALFVALIAYALYRCTRYIDSPTIKNACLLGLALGALALTNGLVTPCGLYLCFLIGILFCKPPRQKHAINLFVSFAVTLTIVVLWWVVLKLARPYNSSPFPGMACLEFHSDRFADFQLHHLFFPERHLVFLACMAFCRLGDLCMASAVAFRACSAPPFIHGHFSGSGLFQPPERRNRPAFILAPSGYPGRTGSADHEAWCNQCH